MAKSKQRRNSKQDQKDNEETEKFRENLASIEKNIEKFNNDLNSFISIFEDYQARIRELNTAYQMIFRSSQRKIKTIKSPAIILRQLNRTGKNRRKES